ncbi:uncharacterized protein CCDC197 isoform X1 [Caretta caretta]|uniref:uncharacterized protein CCDC197 isoform X1 n=1 Tax=Caretta caretta TaxID=8467 RepID=UPI0020958151|nr:uncharacterized protein CCDC197 [Caretta caretta]XP_048710330.1 uncharacterized protein CCDC197 [Caretta caretta]XP_048710331.1 uncharacterized protein CCDC197 [Caretta caretta]
MSYMESLAVPRNDDPRYSLELENRRRNVFVTQLGEHREEEDKDVTHIPIINEAPSKILETDANSLQKTLVLKKEVEADRVTAELIAKRQEFKERMEAVAQRRAQFAKKQQDSRNQALKFDKFLTESNVKRRRALQKYQAEVKTNEIKQTEIDKLVAELEKLKVRQKKLQKKVAKQKVYEDFLLKIIDQLPDNYLEYGADSVIGAIIRRHEMLSATNQTLIKNLITLSDDFEKSQHGLETLQWEHDTTKLMLIWELSELQMKCNRIQEKNKQLEVSINHDKGHFRYQSQELGSLLLAIANLAEQCHMQHYGPLQEMEWLSKLDMIQEFILEKKHIQQLVTQPDESGALLSTLGDKTQSRKMGITKKKFQSQVPGGSGGVIQTPKNNGKASV